MECQACPFNDIVQALAALMKSYAVEEYGPRGVTTTPMNAMEYMASRMRNKKIMAAAKKATPEFTKILEMVERFLPLFQDICITCSQTSDDDNLSRGGQSFVFIESMASSGLASRPDGYDGDIEADIDTSLPSERGDSAIGSIYSDEEAERASSTSHDYLQSHAAIDVHRLDPEGNTKLPAHIEDYLKKVLYSFSQLSLFEQILVFTQMHDMSFAEFGTMKWIPQEMKRAQSKQLISQRWAKIVKRFPLAEVFQKAKPCKGLASELERHFAEEAYNQCEFDFGPPL